MTDFTSKAKIALLFTAGVWASVTANPLYAADAEGLPNLNGSIVYSSKFIQGNPDIGIYRLPKGAGKSPELLVKGPDAEAGGVYADGYFYSTTYLNLWGFFVVTTQKWDLGTHTIAAEYEGDMSNVPLGGAAQDPLTKDIYGIFLNTSADGYIFGKINYGASTMTTTEIAPLPGSWNSMAIDRDGVIYAISLEADIDKETGAYTVTNSYLNTIDRNTGEVTRIGQTGERPQYNSSACIDPRTNRMYWNVSHLDNTTNLCEVDLTTGKATPVYQFADNDVVMGMYVEGNLTLPDAPGLCRAVTLDFVDDSLKGNISLTTPSTLYDGSEASGSLTVRVVANGKIIATVDASYGEALNIPVSLSEAGLYDLTVYALNSEGYGPMTCFKQKYVGKDAPAATTATLTREGTTLKLSWLPVDTSAHGGYINPAEVTYDVTRLPDDVLVKENFNGTDFTETLTEPDKVTDYSYVVVAKYAGRESAPARSNEVSLGSIIPPYESAFAQTGLQDWKVVDANHDGFTWGNLSDGTVMISYNQDSSAIAMDDWLISPPLRLKAGKAYVVSFYAFAQLANYPERIEAKFGMGDSPEELSSVLIAPTEIKAVQASPMLLEGSMEPPVDGNYRIGIHGISDSDSYFLFIKDVSVQGGISDSAPAAPSDLKAVADPDGKLSVEISFTAPEKTIAGNKLESLSKIEICRGKDVVKTFDKVTPGQKLSFTDTPDKGAEYTYSVTAFNENGDGLRAMATVFAGIDLPGVVQGVKATRTNVEGNVTLTWDKVTEDQAGRPLKPENVRYIVYNYSNPSAPVMIASNLTDNNYTFRAVAEGQQDFVQCAVFAATESGIGRGTLSPAIAVGTPYEDVRESFVDGTPAYAWAIESILGGEIRMYGDSTFPNLSSQDSDNGYFGVFAVEQGSGASIVSGLVSLEGAVNPTFSVQTYNLIGSRRDDNKVMVDVMTSDSDEWTNIFTSTVDEIAEGKEGWSRLTLHLDDYVGKVIQVRLTGITGFQSYTLFDNIRIGSMPGQDLSAISLSAPATAVVGSEFPVVMKVANRSEQPSGTYSVRIYEDGDMLAEKEMEALSGDEVATIEFSVMMSPMAEKSIELTGEVIYDQDENTTDNSTQAVKVVPLSSPLPGIKDLTGIYSETEGIELSWTAPDLASIRPEPVTYDFEDGTPFAAEYGNWIFVDGDKRPVGGIQNTPLPGITSGGSTGSFWVWDTDMVGSGNSVFKAHSGSKYLFALYRSDDGRTDDWAISPELCGDAQEVSFYAKSYNGQYPEKIELYYSTGSTDPKDFIKLNDEGGEVPSSWKLYKASLPAGARRFAIHSCAEGSLMLMVDDVTLTPVPPTEGASIEGFDIYRDKTQIASVEKSGYTDSDVSVGKTYVYRVVTRYNIGTSNPSGALTVSTSGIDVVDAPEGNLELYSVDGLRLRNPEKGIVLRRKGGKTEKIFKH